ncbi:methionine--tRNA ligase [Bacillus salitolerans]|uniref:Methionine--tRNA ligase n=1 Tax=Bacillus salitolerans TaxID=1437434 RepID=A0ABW4LNA5_9BACI
MNVFIGGAWPYANGSLHLGHISALLPGDIIARYYRLKGDSVLYVSGSDCNGTPIAIRSRQEGKEVRQIADYYHQEFEDCFTRLGFSFDFYTRTDDIEHHKAVQDIFLHLLSKDLIYRQNVEQSFCVCCDQFLPDRYVEGTCPHCSSEARGDQCDACSTILDPLELLNRRCKLCGNEPTIHNTEHLYFALSTFQQQLENLLSDKKLTWRDNAISLTKRYLNEGLQNRAVSRDLKVGVPIPIEGFEDKKVYVWIDAVSGYLSASMKWSQENNEEWEPFWKGNDIKSYYIHGKDNIPFHTIIWPALLMGLGGLNIPTHIISSEYLTLERKKISTSREYAVWIPDLLSQYDPDSIRYYVTINAPERRDADFSWREFVLSHNGELLGAFGNFINRTLKFIEKSFHGELPRGNCSQKVKEELKELYVSIGKGIEKGELKASLEELFEYIRAANKYFDETKPWQTYKEDINTCINTLYTCVQMIANLSNLLDPFLPFSTNRIREFLHLQEPTWSLIEVENVKVNHIVPLFERIDTTRIEEERRKLGL